MARLFRLDFEFSLASIKSVQPRPSVGAWVLYGLGSENENLPGFVAMCPGGLPIKDSENWQSGFLPGSYQGTYIDPQHTQIDKLIENIRSPHANAIIQARQLELLRKLNSEHRAPRVDRRLESRIQSFELAFRMQTSVPPAGASASAWLRPLVKTQLPSSTTLE